MVVPEWISPLSDSVVPCIQVVLIAQILLASSELAKPLLHRKRAQRLAARNEAEGA
ncbi:MAG: hypothetical protein KDA99_25790 [Planctomycetales bacterium]|nr:hypothetical protein [Planctomycetales bacterium]